MTEELEVLTIVTDRIEGAGIPYMVTGSLAANYYAVPRMTRDIDLVVDLSADDVDRFCALFAGEFYVDPDAARAAVVERVNLIHEAYVVKVDCIVRKDSEYHRTEFRRRRRASVEGRELALVAPEDLIISKLDWMRQSRSEVQLADVRNLLASVPDLDRRYLAHWIDRLGLGALYREAAGE